MLLDTTIKTSNGSGNTLLITPSAVTGLFTSTKLSSTVTTAKADIGVKVCVQSWGDACYPTRLPTLPTRAASFTTSVSSRSAIRCSVTSPFARQVTLAPSARRTPIAPGAQSAGPPDLTGTKTCTCGFDLTLSTLSAHSYNFIAQVPGDNKPHHVRATWKLTGVNQTLGSSNVAACVGPADVTVTQTKIFSNSGSALSF